MILLPHRRETWLTALLVAGAMMVGTLWLMAVYAMIHFAVKFW